jgi:protein-S-isoprenylcysteine O-methyltransferase Ste14
MNRHVWLQDLRNRQRNIVFPDTVENQGNFYRNMLARDARFNPVQRAGLVIMSVVLIGVSIMTIGLLFTDPPNSSIPRFNYIGSVLFAMLLVTIGIRLMKRAVTAPSASHYKRRRKDFQHPTKF